VDAAEVEEACRLLFSHWLARTRLKALPPRLRPGDRSAGYAIQAALEARSVSPLFGWKIAATSAAGQAHINVDGPLAGRILADCVIENGAEISLVDNLMRVAEVEFAFRFAEDLPPRGDPYSIDEVLAAVATLHPAIEIPDSRYEDFTVVGGPQLIADNACAHLFVMGAAASNAWRRRDLALERPVARVLNRYDREGCGANVLGDPRVALTWIANELSAMGVALRSGQVVTTGTCLAPLEIVPGDHVAADFGDFGGVTVNFVH
jgi:2-keto-4-pentenoate hydratase